MVCSAAHLNGGSVKDTFYIVPLNIKLKGVTQETAWPMTPFSFACVPSIILSLILPADCQKIIRSNRTTRIEFAPESL